MEHVKGRREKDLEHVKGRRGTWKNEGGDIEEGEGEISISDLQSLFHRGLKNNTDSLSVSYPLSFLFLS